MIQFQQAITFPGIAQDISDFLSYYTKILTSHDSILNLPQILFT